MIKKQINSTETKKEFINSIHRWLMKTLEANNKEEYKECFVIKDNSIICNLPTNYFDTKEIPEGTIIEMKFVNKRG